MKVDSIKMNDLRSAIIDDGRMDNDWSYCYVQWFAYSIIEEESRICHSPTRGSEIITSLSLSLWIPIKRSLFLLRTRVNYSEL